MSKFTVDTSITFSTKVLQLVIGIGISVIIARVLGPAGKGIYSLAILLPSLLIIFGNLGVGQASVFYLGQKKYSAEEVLANNIIFSFLLGIAGFSIGLAIVLFFSENLFPGVPKAYLILGLFLIPLGFFFGLVNYIFLGLQKIKEFNFIDIFKFFVFLILLSIFLLVFKLGIKAAIIANVISSIIGVTVLLHLAKKNIGHIYFSLNKSYIKDAFSYGSKILFGNIIGFLHYRIDVFLINIFMNPLAVGLYSIAAGLAEKIWLVSQSAGIVLFPKVSSERNEGRLKEFTPLVCRNILILSGIGAVSLFFIGRLLISFFYSDKFVDSILPFQILLIGTVSMSGWRILANDLYGRGKPKLNIYVSFISLILNIILNILWIPKYGITGAAWATSASYTFAFVLIVVVYSRISRNLIYKIIFLQKSDFAFYKKTSLSVVKGLFSKLKKMT